MAHRAKTALAIKAMLGFVQPHLSGRIIGMYEDNERAKVLLKSTGSSPQQEHRCAPSFSSGGCEVGAGEKSQCSLGGTTCKHPYEATMARGVSEAP